MAQQFIETDFQEQIPYAGEYGEQFLGVVAERCNSAGIGLELRPAKRKDGAIVLRGNIKIQASRWQGSGRPISLEVFADRTGSLLDVGWQLKSEDSVSGLLSHTGLGHDLNRALDRGDNNPDRVRQVNRIVGAFHKAVFVPTLNQLAEAMERQQHQSAFFGG